MRSLRTVRRGAVVLALTTGLVAAACGGGGGTAPGQGNGPLLPRTPTALPTFDLSTYQRLLTELRGKPVVVNIWASWCVPCRREGPVLAEAARRYRGKIQFLGVDVLDHVEPARRFIRSYGWIYPSVFDPAGAIRNGLGYLGQPVTLLYGPGGDRVRVWAGEISPESFRAEMAKLAG